MSPDSLRAEHLARREILTRLGHELRTPLNSVIGFSTVLKANRAGNQRAEDLAMLEIIRANGERLLDLVEDLFDLSAPTTTEDVVLVPVDVVAAASAAVRHRNTTVLAKGITIKLKVESEGQVSLDRTRLVRLLQKLVCNAVKFTDCGGVVVTVRARPCGGQPAAVIVQDTGIGIAPELLGTIFEPFTQAEMGTGRSYEGAGLGLPIARRLAESMGCRLVITSEVGIGSQVTVLLPSPSPRGAARLA